MNQTSSETYNDLVLGVCSEGVPSANSATENPCTLIGAGVFCVFLKLRKLYNHLSGGIFAVVTPDRFTRESLGSRNEIGAFSFPDQNNFKVLSPLPL